MFAWARTARSAPGRKSERAQAGFRRANRRRGRNRLGLSVFSGVCIGDRVRIGDRVIIKANAAIGNDGFSFQTVEPGSAEVSRKTGQAQPTESEILRINSVGTVVIEDDVEIGACSCVDRATLHETRIGRGTKIDNLVQIAHNVQIGRKCVIVAMAGSRRKRNHR